MNFFQQEVDAAVDALLWQQVVLYPADTGWNLGCDAEAPRAVALLHRLKGGKVGEPGVVLVADMVMLARYAAVTPETLAALAAAVAAQHQPTTYLLPATKAVAAGLPGPDGTVGLRVVADAFCHRVLRRLGHGLVAVPASKIGEPAPAGYAEIDPAIVRGADHVSRWRRDDLLPALPAQVLRLGADGAVEVVRD